jgi:hypothetical protein
MAEEIFPAEIARRIDDRYRRVMGEPSCCHMVGQIFAADGTGGLDERIVMPLGEDGRHGDGILGATVYNRARVIRDARRDDDPIAARFHPIRRTGLTDPA